MKPLARHIVLARNPNRQEALAQVLSFFDKTSLVRYDRISPDGEGISGNQEGFRTVLERALEKNKSILSGFIKELSETGFQDREDLNRIPQGYQSKVLHIIAHFLDGFIGIDSVFYNLIDDSHWLPESTANELRKEPESFWLFTLDCFSEIPHEASLLHR